MYDSLCMCTFKKITVQVIDIEKSNFDPIELKMFYLYISTQLMKFASDLFRNRNYVLFTMRSLHSGLCCLVQSAYSVMFTECVSTSFLLKSCHYLIKLRYHICYIIHWKFKWIFWIQLLIVFDLLCFSAVRSNHLSRTTRCLNWCRKQTEKRKTKFPSVAHCQALKLAEWRFSGSSDASMLTLC